MKKKEPKKEEVWKQLCEATGARLVSAGFLKGKKVEKQYKQWTITLDTYDRNPFRWIDWISWNEELGSTDLIFTRFRAPYLSPKEFRFSVYRKGLFSVLGKLFGMKDISLGDEEFDETYIIKGSNKEKTKELLQDEIIKTILMRHKGIQLTCIQGKGNLKWRAPKNGYLINIELYGIIKDLVLLKDMILLIERLLDRLCEHEIADSSSPAKLRVK